MITSIDITGIKYDLGQQDRPYVENKIGRLDRYVPVAIRGALSADVKLKHVNGTPDLQYEAEVILAAPEKTLAATAAGATVFAAIDLVEEKLATQLKKYKAALVDRKIQQG